MNSIPTCSSDAKSLFAKLLGGALCSWHNPHFPFQNLEPRPVPTTRLWRLLQHKRRPRWCSERPAWPPASLPRVLAKCSPDGLRRQPGLPRRCADAWPQVPTASPSHLGRTREKSQGGTVIHPDRPQDSDIPVVGGVFLRKLETFRY